VEAESYNPTLPLLVRRRILLHLSSYLRNTLDLQEQHHGRINIADSSPSRASDGIEDAVTDVYIFSRHVLGGLFLFNSCFDCALIARLYRILKRMMSSTIRLFSSVGGEIAHHQLEVHGVDSQPEATFKPRVAEVEVRRGCKFRSVRRDSWRTGQVWPCSQDDVY
jgi:hypothetical protein